MPLRRPDTGFFAARMAALGPWGPSPFIAVGVSGGADSLALALLAAHWVGQQGGQVLALIVDHGLRPEAVPEARDTAAQLAEQGIAARILTLSNVRKQAASARDARLAALEACCAELGILHLLLAQHAGDQAETRLIRSLAGSAQAGRAAMPALRFSGAVRIVRPLLDVAPVDLQALVQKAGLFAVRDPSNSDPRATRARLRALRRDAAGTGPATRALCAAARADGMARATVEASLAEELAAIVRIYPGGYASLCPGPWPEAVLGALLRTLGGHVWPVAGAARLAENPVPATRAGLRLLRRGGGFLLCREEAAMQPAIPARAGILWDRRFLVGDNFLQIECFIGGLGDDAACFRRHHTLPSAVLRSLPTIRDSHGKLLAVPHLDGTLEDYPVTFAPLVPLMGAPFRPLL